MADTPGKKTIMVPKVVNGIETMVPMVVDDTAGPSWGPREQMSVLNKPIRRVDGPAKVTGTAKYSHDIRLPNMLFGRMLPAPHASARVTAIDTTDAKNMPGVAVVIDWGLKTVRFQGDPIAAVAAETPELAEDAIRAIKVTYQVLPHLVDADSALAPDAPNIFPDGNVRPDSPHGDAALVAAAMKECAVTVTGEFRTPVQHHATLETHGVVVDYTGGDSATVYASTQGTFTIPGDAARTLGLDASKVVAITEYMGGGFGSKFGTDVPGDCACKLARQAQRPVHLLLTRADEFVMAGNRSASLQRLTLGALADGTFHAMTAEQHRMGGVGGGSQRDQPFIYQVQNVYRTMDSVHTNIDSSRAMRAPGNPQASFPMESLVDDIAAKLDMDPLDVRKKNHGDPVHHAQMDLAAQTIGWATGRNKRPGEGQTGPKKRGMGCGLTAWGGGGGPSCTVTVTIGADGAVDVSVGTQDLGTGSRTYTGAIVAEEFGLPASAVRTHIGDSRLGSANSSGGSTTTASLAPAVKDAAYNARMALFARIAPAMNAKPEDLAAANGKIVTQAGQSLTWKQACAALGSTGITATGVWKDGLSSGGVAGVQFAEVEVDTETGKVKVLKMAAVQNCGLPLNRRGIESQMNGGMLQGLGYGLFESKVTDKETGLMLNANFEEYKLPGSMEVPECIPIIDDTDTRGVIGVAEACDIPAAGAIANAIFNATGVRVRTLPITPDKILAGLAETYPTQPTPPRASAPLPQREGSEPTPPRASAPLPQREGDRLQRLVSESGHGLDGGLLS